MSIITKLKERRFKQKLQEQIDELNSQALEDYNTQVRTKKIRKELDREISKFLLE